MRAASLYLFYNQWFARIWQQTRLFCLMRVLSQIKRNILVRG